MSERPFIERRSIDYVPLAERHGKVWHLWPVWFSGGAHLVTLAVGAIGISLGLNLPWTALAVLGGVALGTFFMAFHATQGPQLGLPQMIQSRPQFGHVGALLVWGVALVSYIGYNAANLVLAAESVQVFAHVSTRGTILIFSLLAVAIAVVGYDWIHRAQRWVAYSLIALLTVFTLAALRLKLPAAALSLADFRTVPFLTQFFATAAYQLSWSIYVSDYSRYLPRDVGVGPSFWWTYVGAFIGGAWMMLVGSVAAAVVPGSDVAASLKQAADLALPGLGVPILLGSLFGLLTITTLNYYGASLTLMSVADSFRKLSCTITQRLVALAIATIATTAIALAAAGDFLSGLTDLLAVLLYLFTPWTAINLVDFYVVRKGHYSVREIFNPSGMYGRWNWRGLGAYFVGFAAMIPFFSTERFHGPVARMLGGADIAMLVGLPVSALVYLWACRGLDLEAEKARARAADLGLG
jgi:nucleobase:cation symporter-1, NCS1 family